MLLHEYLTRSAQRFPGKTALICGGDRKTYADLHTATEAFADFLLAKGLERGDRVFLCHENSPEAVVAILGTLAAGGCFVAVNPVTPAERTMYLLENSGARFLVSTRAKLQELQRAHGDDLPAVRKIVTRTDDLPPGAFLYEQIVRRSPEHHYPGIVSTDLAAIIYTSGSTGKPKGVTLTHLNIDTVAESVEEYLGNHPDDVILCLLQLSFGYGLLQLLVTLRTGGTLVLEKGFGYPYDIVEKLKKFRVTGFAGVPTLFALLFQLTRTDTEGFPSLRYITNAAAAMPQAFIPKIQRMFPGTRIYLMHGLTEVLRTTYLPPEEIEKRPGSVGKGMKNVELWIEDADGRRLGPGRVGELVVRGANVMQGYWNDPEATSRVLLPGRYPWERVMHTGDLFTVDEDGYFSFVSRMDDVIKCRGEKVSPLEVENVLYRMEGVVECRVLGVPDPVLGQTVRAEIVLDGGRVPDERAVRAHCKLHLEDYKIPHSIAFVEEIPKTQGGKIRRV